MSEVSVIEQELLDATKYKGKKGAKREDYLAGLVKAVEKLEADDFDGLSDAAADWYNSAVEAMNDKDPPPEFADAEAHEDEDGADVEADGDETDDTDTAGDPTDDDDDVGAADAEGSDDAEGDADEESEEARPPPKKAAKVVKPAKKAKGNKPSQQERFKTPKDKIDPSRYDKITGEKDRFGVIKGTKTSDAVALFARPQGATAAQIHEALGGRFYNITRKLAKDGHHVEKMEGGVLRIIHRDDYGKKVKAGAPKKGK